MAVMAAMEVAVTMRMAIAAPDITTRPKTAIVNTVFMDIMSMPAMAITMMIAPVLKVRWL